MTASLTERFVARVKAPVSGNKNHRDEYFDRKMPGLGLRVSLSGRKTWCVVARFEKDKSRLRRVSLGTYPKLNAKEARCVARRIFREDQQRASIRKYRTT